MRRALRLARLQPGERLLDIGCGDGRVLSVAAQAGALVTGVETDEELVSVARQHLADDRLDGTVIHGDAFDIDLEADVVFAYLSPAILQRLRPRLQAARPGTRLVTIDFAVPGLVATRVVGGVHLYELPAGTAQPAPVTGWSSAGTLIAALPEYESLTTLEFAHPGGPVHARWNDDLDAAASFYLGADKADRRERVAVDIRWHELEEGTLVTGGIDVDEAGFHYVVALFTHDDNGMWELSERGVNNLAQRLSREPAPGSWSELLAAAEDPAS